MSKHGLLSDCDTLAFSTDLAHSRDLDLCEREAMVLQMLNACTSFIGPDYSAEPLSADATITAVRHGLSLRPESCYATLCSIAER